MLHTYLASEAHALVHRSAEPETSKEAARLVTIGQTDAAMPTILAAVKRGMRTDVLDRIAVGWVRYDELAAVTLAALIYLDHETPGA